MLGKNLIVGNFCPVYFLYHFREFGDGSTVCCWNKDNFVYAAWQNVEIRFHGVADLL